MEASLYSEPEGFYQRRIPGEDFYTAPELHPAFAAVLSTELARLLGEVARTGRKPRLVEAGCGDGTLFRAVVEGIKGSVPDLFGKLDFALVERSRPALATALTRSQDLGPRLVGASSLDELEPFSGVLYSNELLDALPFHLLEKHDGRVWEVLVEDNGEPRLAPPPAGPLSAAAEAVLEGLGEGGRHAVCLQRADWLGQVASKLRSGFLVTIDYGRRYPPDAPVTPKTYRRHHLGSDLFALGQDITAPVDFQAMMVEGKRVGLEPERFETMGGFLLERGIGDWFEKTTDYSERNRLKTLIHPEGMGEIFKVLVQSKGL